MHDIFKYCHDGPCGGHFADKRTTYKILQSGYYWPTIFKDAKKYVASCDDCQRMGKPTAVDEMPLQAQVVIEPFEKWALDFVGPINPMSRRKNYNYILVCIYYVTKWVESKALYSANEQSIVDIAFEEIFTRFIVPREIVTDQGTQFTSNLVKALTEQYEIKHIKYSRYHPQENGQVESTNKVIEAIPTKIVQLHHKDWVDRLPGALWAYRTTWRNTTSHTPYELVYEKQVLLPIECQVKTCRTAMQLGMDLDDAKKQRLLQLNELDEIK